MGILFNFDKSCAHEWVHRLLPVLETALGKKQALPFISQQVYWQLDIRLKKF